MQGYSIINQSDERYKKNIKESKASVLDLYRSIKFYNFEYTHHEMARGVHYGLLAQRSKDLGVYKEDIDKWQVDTSLQIMYNSRGVQELILMHDQTERTIQKLDGHHHQLSNKVVQLESYVKNKIEIKLRES